VVASSGDSSSLPLAKDEPEDRDGLSPVSIQIGTFDTTLIRIRDLGIQAKYDSLALFIWHDLYK